MKRHQKSDTEPYLERILSDIFTLVLRLFNYNNR